MKKFGCYSFQYSGCGGNGNSFETKNECSKLCIGKAAFNSSRELDDKKAMDEELHQVAKTKNQPLIKNIKGKFLLLQMCSPSHPNYVIMSVF